MLGHIGGGVRRDTGIGDPQSRDIVDAIPEKPDGVSTLAQGRHDPRLVRRRQLGEHTRSRRHRTQPQVAEPVDLVAHNSCLGIHADLRRHLARDDLAVPGQYLHRHTVIGKTAHCAGSAVADRVDESHESGQDEIVLVGFPVPLKPRGPVLSTATASTRMPCLR